MLFMNTKKITGALLVGGLGSRMGYRNKALLTLNEESFLERTLKNYDEIFDEILLVVRDEKDFLAYASQKVRIVLDVFEQQSSLTGMHAALTHATNDTVFIAAGDSPFLEKDTISALISTLEKDADITVPLKDDGFYEPLFALYSKKCIPFIEKELRANNFKIITFFPYLKVQNVPVAILKKIDPKLRCFENINTPEELALLQKKNEQIILSRAEAIESLVQCIFPEIEKININKCLGRVLAEDIISQIDAPSLLCANYDGFALNSEETFTASKKNALSFPVIKSLTPSDKQLKKTTKKSCYKVFTGAILPNNIDTIIPFEDAKTRSAIKSVKATKDINSADSTRNAETKNGELNQYIKDTKDIHNTKCTHKGEFVHTIHNIAETVIVTEALSAFAYCRKKGTDIKKGELLAKKDTVINSSTIANLCFLRIKEVFVYRMPKILLIATGNELTKGTNANKIPADNLLLLENLCKTFGVQDIKTALVKDNAQDITDAIESSPADIVITTGGTGFGDMDFTHKIVNTINYTTLFTKLAARPIKSVFAATFSTHVDNVATNMKKDTKKILLGFPGRPAAVLSCFYALVRPLLFAYTKRVCTYRYALLKENITETYKEEYLLSCDLFFEDASLYACPLDKKTARLSMQETKGLIIIAKEKKLMAGSKVPVIPFKNSLEEL